METELCKIMQKHKSDKSILIQHSYSPEYHKILTNYRDSARYILEIGVGTKNLMEPIVGDEYKVGASLYAWMEYFQNATIIGVDIVREVLFNHERITCFYGDQSSNESLIDFIESANTVFSENIKYDLIIDDGSHILEHQITSLKALVSKLNKGGVYIIEDIPIGNIQKILRLPLVNNLQTLKVHYGEWSGDNFIAFKTKTP
jgi:hypothetical protein